LKGYLISSPRRFLSGFYQASKVTFPGWWLRRLIGNGAEIFSYTPIGERLMIYQEASLALKLGRFLEVGSHLGASTVVLAEVLKRGGSQAESRVYCIDTWNNDAMSLGPKDTWREFQLNTAAWAPFVIPVRGDSKTVPIPFPGCCDLVFLDGDHSYDGASADADRFAPLVRLGGRLLIHDHDRCSVARVLGGLLVTGRWTVANTRGHLISLKREEPE
jgi:hypothetical protein